MLILIALFCSAGCAQPPVEIVAPTNLNEQLQTLGVAPYVSPTPSPQEPTPPAEVATSSPAFCPKPYLEVETQRPEYDLSVYLGIEQHAGHVEETIIYPNMTGELLSGILLAVEPNQQPGVFSISTVSIAGEQIDGYLLEGGILEVPLQNPLPDGCQAELSITFHLDFPEQAGIFGYTEDQLVMTNWYPFVPPYQPGSGWVIHPPGLYAEHLVYPSANFSVTLEIADPAENILVAAAAPAVEEAGKYHFELLGARTFSMAVLTDYSLRTQNLNGIEISVYSRRATIREVEAALGAASAALQVFEGVYGPYSIESLTIAQLEMYDGMEYDGIFFLGEEVFSSFNYSSANMLIYLVVHETAHNWWFSQVGNDQALEPWLDEALSTYSEVLFYEIAYPELVDWWWEFRIEEYDPLGIVDASIYDYVIYEDYRRAVYLNGAEFLQALREQIGDEVFFALLRSYLEQGRYQLLTTEDFFRLLEEDLGEDASALRQEYFGKQ
jgi:hypothetical protein